MFMFNRITCDNLQNFWFVCLLLFLGSRRDSDEQLEPLCEDWLRIKGEVTSKKASYKYEDSFPSLMCP